MPRQTPSASDYTSVVRSSAIANDVASKPTGSPGAAKAAAAAVRGGGGLGSLGAIGSIVKQSVVARSIAPLPVRAEVQSVPLLPLELTGGTSDAFVVAYSSSGTALWTAKIHSSGTDIAYSVCTDSNGNIYVTGAGGSGTVSARNADGTPFTTTLTNVGAGDAFIAKYNTNGIVQWVVKIGSTDADAGLEITTDSNNNVYVVGKGGSGTVTAFNANQTPFSTTLPNAGQGDAFIVKYSSSGLVQWVTRIASSGPDSAALDSGGIATDGSGNVYVGIIGADTQDLTVYNADSSSFGTTILNTGAQDMGIVKYNSSGVVQWVTRIASASDDVPYALVTDSSGNLYVGGYYGNATVTLYNSDRTPFGTTFFNDYFADGLIAKYNSDGFVQWALRIGNTFKQEGVYGMCTDSNGNLYAVGTHSSPTPIRNSDGSTFVNLADNGERDAFVVKYNPSGFVQWAGRISTSGIADIAWGVCADSTGSIYVVGQSHANTNITAFSANGTTTGLQFGKTLSNIGGNDAFIVKYNTNGIVQWLTSIAGTGNDIARSVAADNTGKIYIAGSFASSQLIAYNA